MRFFFDNCVSPYHAQAINALCTPDGHSAVHLGEMFRRDTPDVVWITTLVSKGDWIILSGDLRITRNKQEKDAWLRSGLTGFFLAKGWGNLSFWDQAALLVRNWPDIIQQAELVGPGAGFLVKPKTSRFEQIRVA